jgi:hypothetical protein
MCITNCPKFKREVENADSGFEPLVLNYSTNNGV